MAHASDSLRLLAFEQVQASAETALLRIQVAVDDDGGEPPPEGSGTLILYDGAVTHRFKPLPAPRVPSDFMRLAFAVALELLERQQTLALELRGTLLDLPAPTPATGRPILASPLAPPPRNGPDRRRSSYWLLARQSEQLLSLETALADNEKRFEAENGARIQAERRVEALTRELRAASDGADGEVIRLRDRCSVLEHDLEEALGEVRAMNDAYRRVADQPSPVANGPSGPIGSPDTT
jgi:hypothetical protein